MALGRASRGLVVAAVLGALPATARADTPDDALLRGQRLYEQACASCHGVDGTGNGPAARWLDPKPRDFTRAVYKFRTTMTGTIPTDDDLRRSVDMGVPGTSMPAWRGVLSPADRDAVVAYLKTFSDWFEDGVYPEDVLVTPAAIAQPPPRTDAALESGRALYARMECAKCHGEDGRGNPDNPLVDDWDREIVAFDFTKGTYKGGSRPEEIYRSFTTGLDGTPMPSYADSLDEAERWDLVYYVESLHRKRGPLDWLLDPPTANHPIPRRGSTE